ncbi:DNA polymerase I [Oceanicella actignis]|uniref:DNA polymerase I n=1 Tax=Oceanicella actignis TaxID=1189325 RepID=A0A1M7TYN0_9RHOB|nr:DNA polymerase I [Oceanicella actignis]SET81791.1 DNA polymerase I [Oceanicella actignis]SHN75750.1 DNA polymerase I [Oceanicella actignis]
MSGQGRPLGPGDHLELVDGSGFIFRAYHALPPLTRRSDGLPVGAVAGFCNMIQKMIAERAADGDASGCPVTHAAVIFDHPGKTFRNDIFPEYKANRPPPPEDLVPQFPLVREAARAYNLPVIEAEGWEADDIIATYARLAREAGAKVTIISSDKDLMQLVDERVRLVDGMKNQVIGPEEVEARFGVPPERVVDVQALAGDPVDNVPGAPGIGVKTAAKLIREYGDLENLLAHAQDIPQPKRRQTLLENAERIRMSRRLVELARDVPPPLPLEELALRKPDPQALLDFLSRMEFRTLLRRAARTLGVEPPAAPAPRPAETGSDAGADAAQADPPAAIDRDGYEVVRDAAALARWIEMMNERGEAAIDVETTSLDEMRADLVGLSICVAPGRACYVPFRHVEGDGDLLGARKPAPGQMDRDEALRMLAPTLADPAVLKIGHNIKYDMKVLARHGAPVICHEDTMLISYALDAGLHGHGMDELSHLHLGHEPLGIKELIGSGKSAITFDRVPLDKAAPYAAEDADVTWRLRDALRGRLPREGLATVYETLERPLVPVLAQMEMTGVKVDVPRLNRLSNEFAARMAELEAEIHALAGQSFNVGSPRQLGEILFEKMGLPGGKKGKSGAWSTPADVLETLAAEGNELAARVLDWRQLAKLKSTYTDALPGHVNPETGRVHTSFSLAATTTGRLASTDPNLQNIPVRTEAGRAIREAFVAEEGSVIVSLDYSQIELRILAHIADVPALKDAFRKGMDIHAMTASEVFGVPVEGMDPMVRRRAKAINFGVIYGISPFGLANQLGISRDEARAFIDAYFQKFPEIRVYMDRTVEEARRDGFVRTIFGRRIHTPEINARGPRAGFQQRAAINAPIQGSAADVIRRAMIRAPAALREADLRARMLLQVHDELLFECPEDEAPRLIEVMRAVMEGAPEPAVAMSTPLKVDAGVGRSWAEAH